MHKKRQDMKKAIMDHLKSWRGSIGGLEWFESTIVGKSFLGRTHD